MSISRCSPSLFSLQDKIEATEKVIREAYEKNNGKIYISCSFGKDSTILRDIALRLYPDLPVVFSNTTNERQEIIQYMKKHPNVIVVTPEKSFKEVIETEGFPLVSKEVSQKTNELKHTNGYRTRMLRYYGNNKGDSVLSKKWHSLAEQPFDISSKCCKILKKDALEKWAKKEGLKPLIALMSDESRLRQQLSLYGKDDGKKKIYPFLRTGWTQADVWEYARQYDIRFAECYYDRVVNGILIKALKQSGCEYCHYGEHLEDGDRFASSRILTPKRYEKMMKISNNGVTFAEVSNIASSPPEEYLGLYGGIVLNKTVDEKFDKEIYKFQIVSDAIECPCCSKKGTKAIATKDISVYSSFVDAPNPTTNKKRVIECYYDYCTCKQCGMTLVNHLHMFDMRFNVTKRLIDYIYANLDKKPSFQIADETGLPIEDIHEIVHVHYKKDFMRAYKNNYSSIWFNENNELIA